MNPSFQSCLPGFSIGFGLFVVAAGIEALSSKKTEAKQHGHAEAKH